MKTVKISLRIPGETKGLNDNSGNLNSVPLGKTLDEG